MSDDIKKSNYGPKGTAAGAQYNPHENQERKARNTGERPGLGPNKNEKAYSSKPGQLSAKQQADAEMTLTNRKKMSGPVKVLSQEEIAALGNKLTPPSKMKKDEMLDIEADGKQETVEGKEPLKKDPKKRWKELKKALDNKSAILDMKELMGSEDEAQEGNAQPQASDLEQELSPEDGEEEQGDDQQEEQPEGEADSEAVSDGSDDGEEQPEEEQDDPESGNGEIPVDPQELIEALKNEGYNDQEIAYVVHGHHAPEVDPTKQAKADATAAMSDHDLNSAKNMAELEHDHARQSLEQERAHKQRMSDLEYEAAQKKHALAQQDSEHKRRMSDVEFEQAQSTNPASQEAAHKQRMLDLEYEKAKKASAVDDGSDADGEANRQMKALEVQQKKLELKLREEEIKLEIEFKRREHELKLKMMEQSMKAQAKQQDEMSTVKHQMKMDSVMNSEPKEDAGKKPAKKVKKDE